MEIEKQNITVAAASGVSELVIRHGEAAPVVVPEKYLFAGNIEAPFAYMTARNAATNNGHFNPKTAVLQVNRNSGSLSLFQNPNDPIADAITGTAKQASELDGWKFNTDHRWRASDLAEFLRRNRRHFSDPSRLSDLIGELRSMKVTTNGDIQTADDKRGNKKSLFEQSVQSNIPVSFDVDLPIIAGQKPSRVKVEIFIEVTGQSVSLILDSIDVADLLVTERDRLLNEQIDKFKPTNIPIVEV